jgi:hypothetical protein
LGASTLSVAAWLISSRICATCPAKFYDMARPLLGSQDGPAFDRMEETEHDNRKLGLDLGKNWVHMLELRLRAILADESARLPARVRRRRPGGAGTGGRAIVAGSLKRRSKRRPE